jgi:hypothetical protein
MCNFAEISFPIIKHLTFYTNIFQQKLVVKVIILVTISVVVVLRMCLHYC